MIIDTNIFLDVLQNRTPFVTASNSVIASCIQNKNHGFVTAHSICDMFFILRKSHDINARKNTVRLICNYFTVISETRDDFLSVANDVAKIDLEDGLQIVCAEKFSLDYIISRDASGFVISGVPMVTPDDFLKISN